MRRLAIAGAATGAVAGSLGLAAPVLARSLGTAQSAPGVTQLPGQLQFLANPTIAFGLLLLALVGIGLELVHPGAIVPGVVGLIAGVLAVTGLLGLPLDLLGLLLVAAATALFVVDLVAPTHGVLTFAGIAAAVAGGVLMFRGQPVNPVVLVGLPIGLGGTWLVLSRRALAVRHRPYPHQPQELLGEVGVIRESQAGSALALVDGELWRAVARDGSPLEVGSEIEVLAQDGLTLIVDVIGLPRVRGTNEDREGRAAVSTGPTAGGVRS